MGELGTEVCLHAENLRAVGGKGGTGLQSVVLVVNEVIRVMSHAFSHVLL